MTDEERISELREVLAARFASFETTMQLLAELAELDPKHGIPQDYYFAGAKTFPTNGVAIAMLKKLADGSDHVFLVRQPDNHPLWPGMWHIPGTTQRPGDKSINAMFRRIWDEIGPAADRISTTPVHAFDEITTGRINERGSGMHRVHVCWVPAGTQFAAGQFFPLREPPQNTIKFVRWLLAKLYRWVEQGKPATPKKRRRKPKQK